MTKKKDDAAKGPELPGYITEPGFPDGDGPVWIAQALGADAEVRATAYRGTNDDETAIALFLGKVETVFRPARMVTTRRLVDSLGAKGFPVPYYQPPQIARIGQAIGRLAHRELEAEDDRATDDLASLLGGWLCDCLRENVGYVLRGRAGADVRDAVKHVRTGRTTGSVTVPLIFEPERGKHGTLLAWSLAVRTVIRDRLGTMSDGEIGVQLQRAGLVRDRLDARPGPDDHGTVGMPFWVIPNGWEAVEAEIPADSSDSRAVALNRVRDRSDA